MKEIVPDYRLDMVGEPCPYPAVATLEALPQLQKGNSRSGERLPAVHQQHSSGCQKPRLHRTGYSAGWPDHSLSYPEVNRQVTGASPPKSCLTSHFDGEHSASENGSTTLKVDKNKQEVRYV